jgi:hypothetical protein
VALLMSQVVVAWAAALMAGTLVVACMSAFLLSKVNMT